MTTLEDYRSRIRETDRQLLALLRDRLSLSDKIAHVKEEGSLPTVDPEAEQRTMDNLLQTANELGLGSSFAKRLGQLLIEESIRIQKERRPEQSKDQLLKEIFEVTQKLLQQGEKITRFEIGEPNFAPPRQMVRELSGTFRRKRIIGYGPAAGLPELRKALADELNREHEIEIDPDQILVTPGARFAIFATITSFVSSLERVVIPQPAWPAYEESVDFVNGRVIPLNTKLEDDWEIDLSQLELELSKGARMLVLNSPNNPTGKMISKNRFEEILSLARKYGAIVLSDEVYDRFARNKPPSVLESEYENTVYINSFSKQFALTGWRIAYLVTSKEKANRIRRVIQTAVTCVPEFIQRAALVGLKKGRKEAQRHVNSILDKVDLTCQELRKINVSFYKPDGAFYVFPRANKPNFDSAKFARALLERHHVSISPGQSFGNYPAFFRLAVSLPRAQIPAAIERIGKAIEEWS